MSADNSIRRSIRAPRRRGILGRVALVAWAAGAPMTATGMAVVAAAGPAHASTTSTTTPPSPPPPLGVALSPCDPPRQGAACGVDPSQLQVNIPSGTDVTAVEVSWVSEPGRSSPVPSANPPTILSVSNSASCGGGLCWNWPQSIDYRAGGNPWVLNGTYQVSPCAGQSTNSCTPSANYAPSQVEIAAAPAVPENLSASSQGGTITMRWQAGPEPDLVGYLVTRNSEDIYTCSINGFGPGAGHPCASPPSFSDYPGVGNWRYQVEALRFGQDASAAHVIRSLPASAVASVAGAAIGGNTGSAGSPGGNPPAVHIYIPPIPAAGVMPSFSSPAGVAGRAPTTADAPEGEPGVTQGNPNLPYSDNPALAGAQAEATGTSERPPPKPVRNVNSVAEIALAVIALSLAIHAWYVRDELRRAAARVAARQAMDQRGLQST